MNPKKPRHIAILDGSARKNPSRYNTQDRQHTEGLAPPPAHLTDEQRAVYIELSEAALPGLLQRSDSVCVEIAACLLSEYRQHPADFAVGKFSVLRGLTRDLGLSPDGRQRFGIAPESDDGNEFDAF